MNPRVSQLPRSRRGRRLVVPDPAWRGLLCLALAVALLLPVTGARALQVVGLYEQQVPVANDSDGERRRAYREAFEAVVVKVTGERRWAEHPAVQQAASNAQRYVEGISYSSAIVPIPQEELEAMMEERASELLEASAPDTDQSELPPLPTTREQRYITVDFADALINNMLAAADIPTWNANRPSVLVWMVLQDPNGTRSMLSDDSNPEIVELVREFARNRGLPIIFPVLDFADRRNLNEDQVWRQEEAPIREASERYGADSILAVRLHFTASGELVGLWKFIFQDDVQVFDGFATELEDYLYEPLDRITTQLASYFAISPESNVQQVVNLRVDGVGNLQDYAALLSYVGGLGVVQGVTTRHLEGERLDLQLSVLGSARQLNELISLDRDLLPVSDSEPQERRARQARQEQDPLHYRWTR